MKAVAAEGVIRCARHMNASTVQNPAARHSWASAGWIHRAAQSAASFGVNLASRHPATDPASKPRGPPVDGLGGVGARPQVQVGLCR